MSRKTDKRRLRFYGIFSDPWRKLISVGLGILLWYLLNASITKSHTAELTLQFNQASRPGDVTIQLGAGFALKRYLNGENREKELSTVTLEFEGSNRQISDLKKRLEFEIKLAESDIQSTDPPSVVFRLEDIHFPKSPALDSLLKEMTPRTILIELEPNHSQNLLLTKDNVNLDLEGVDEGRILDAIFEPKRIEIFGPQALIQRIDNQTKLFTAKITARDIETSSKISRLLTIAPEFEKSGITVPKPHVTYNVEPKRVQFLLKGVPVVLDTQQVSREDGAKFEVKQKTVDILIRASGDLHAALFNHVHAGEDVHEVVEDWSQKHARVRVYLRRENLSEDPILTRTPSLVLFSLDPHDKVTHFVRGPDYVVPEQTSLQIDIVKRKL